MYKAHRSNKSTSDYIERLKFFPWSWSTQLGKQYSAVLCRLWNLESFFQKQPTLIHTPLSAWEVVQYWALHCMGGQYGHDHSEYHVACSALHALKSEFLLWSFLLFNHGIQILFILQNIAVLQTCLLAQSQFKVVVSKVSFTYFDTCTTASSHCVHPSNVLCLYDGCRGNGKFRALLSPVDVWCVH